VIGGGLPLAAVGGRADLMDELAPVGAVYQAGTLSGNPLATTAGLAVLSLLDADAYTALERTATRLADGLRAVLGEAGVAAQVPRAATLVGLFFSDQPVQDYDGARAADHQAYTRFFHGALDAGVYFAPSGYEAIFPSLAHTDADIDATLEAATRAFS
jgi:glutamate-1-semialdehyde 2,1-aminomutase